MAKEKNLTSITTVAAADFARIVTSAGASVKATAANLAKYVIETYNGSSVAGSTQSVKTALDALGATKTTIAKPSSTPSTITIGDVWNVYITRDSRFATLQMNFNVLSATTVDNAIVTLPSDVRPSSNVLKMSITQAGKPYILSVSTGGVLTLHFMDAISSSVFVRETFTFSML